MSQIERSEVMNTFPKTTLLVCVLVSFLGLHSTAYSTDHNSRGQRSLKITEVFVNSEDDTLTITGRNFDLRGNLQVQLGQLGGLPIVGVPSATEIVAGIPQELTAGDYRLKVSRGRQNRKNDTFDLTIGAIGSAGEPGEDGTDCTILGTIVSCDDGRQADVQGPPGPQGPVGPQGPAGGLGPNSVTSIEVVDNSLTGADITGLTGSDIANGSITAADISSIRPGQIRPAPLQFERFTLASNGTIVTRWPAQDWVVTITGFQALNGDIQENGVGDPLFVYPFVRDGRWQIRFDLRSHNTNERWRIWAMAVRREMTQLFGGYATPE